MPDIQCSVDIELEIVRVSPYAVEMLDTQHAVDADLRTVMVSHQLIEMPNIQHAVDAELETALVSRQLCELPHALPVQAFAVRLCLENSQNGHNHRLRLPSRVWPRLSRALSDERLLSPPQAARRTARPAPAPFAHNAGGAVPLDRTVVSRTPFVIVLTVKIFVHMM
ncbi:hypothetical protein EVAR_35276_1 [Eumeta japonica]|uniref:Uncharacterized protein n=1 Tax=Eumeta variegata TaxID=151549 RepID=A0A4C1VDT5_EUMVA|nr:hypothetical protein EVAR_35276_1 [Eumeta japonica]